jgi:hypothetical protein
MISTMRRNEQRTRRQGRFVWISVMCVLVGEVCHAQFQIIRQRQPRRKHNGQTRNNNEAFGMQFVTDGGDKLTISEKAGDILMQPPSPSPSSTAQLPSSPTEIPANRIWNRKRHQRFRPRRAIPTPSPNDFNPILQDPPNDFKLIPIASLPKRTRPPKSLSTELPTKSPTTGCPSIIDDGSIGDATWREDDIIVQYSYEISLSENTEDMSEILTSITQHVMEIVMTLMARCDTVSGRWQLQQQQQQQQQQEEINRQLQQEMGQLELVGLSGSNAKLLDGK